MSGLTSPYSEVTVANLALSHCESPQLVSLDQSGLAASQCRLHLPVARDAALQDHDWGFASRFHTLSKDIAAPSFGFPSAYTLPGSVLVVRQVNRDPYARWKRNGAQIHGNFGTTVKIRSTDRVTRPADWSALFVTAFALRLGIAIAPQLVRSTSKLQELRAAYDSALHEAKRVNSQEGWLDEFEGDEEGEILWTDARSGGYF